MKEEKLKQELTPTVEKKKLLTGSLLENIVFWVAIIASAILAFYFFFGEKIGSNLDTLHIIQRKNHKCKGVGCGECGWVGLVMPVSREPLEHLKKSPNNDW